jgi:hypothetical protein
LTVFCPDDMAVAAFEANFNSLGAADKLAVLLLHTAAARYGREQLAAFDSVTVRMIDVDPATSKNRVLTVRDDGETVRLFLWPSRGSGGAATTARVTKDLSSGYFAVYVVDTVLLPDHLRQRLDGGDEEAAACTEKMWLSTISATPPLLQYMHRFRKSLSVSAALTRLGIMD